MNRLDSMYFVCISVMTQQLFKAVIAVGSSILGVTLELLPLETLNQSNTTFRKSSNIARIITFVKNCKNQYDKRLLLLRFSLNDLYCSWKGFGIFYGDFKAPGKLGKLQI